MSTYATDTEKASGTVLGADAIVELIQDVKWQEAQRMIEEYGRECYERGLSEKEANLSTALAFERAAERQADEANAEVRRLRTGGLLCGAHERGLSNKEQCPCAVDSEERCS